MTSRLRPRFGAIDGLWQVFWQVELGRVVRQRSDPFITSVEQGLYCVLQGACFHALLRREGTALDRRSCPQSCPPRDDERPRRGARAGMALCSRLRRQARQVGADDIGDNRGRSPVVGCLSAADSFAVPARWRRGRRSCLWQARTPVSPARDTSSVDWRRRPCATGHSGRVSRCLR
jgi:hypothetical protein